MKQITDYPNYSITEDGIVINQKKNRKLNPIINGKGYYQVKLYNQGNVKVFLVHRLIAKAFIPNIENKPFINHINAIKHDNRLCNLEWVTASENTKHAYKLGLFENKNKAVKLSNSKIVLDTQTGIFYNSAKEASTLLGINENTLYSFLVGTNKNKTSLIYA